MRIRSRLKHLAYGARPFYRGTFPYFAHAVYFPLGSHLFMRVCQDGIYEKDTVKLVSSLIKPDTTYLDVGANIGLLSIPVLVERPEARVISIEASPDTLRHLERTHAASRHRERWMIVGCAIGKARGSATFYASRPENGAFDGLKDTGRGGGKQTVTVEVRPLDEIWQEAGSPKVSVVKIDVEGAETDVIAGAPALIARERPVLVIEWSKLNLPAYGVEPAQLFNLCHEIGYRAYAYPSLCEVANVPILHAAMAQTDTFVLVPKTGVATGV